MLLLAFYFAGAMLGVDDNVIFLKFHPAIVRLRRLIASLRMGKTGQNHASNDHIKALRPDRAPRKSLCDP